MKFTIPVYVKQLPPDEEGIGSYEVSPLFVPYHSIRNELLSRAMTRLARDIRKTLHSLGRQKQTEEMAPWSFCPTVEEHRYDIDVELRRRVAHCRFLVIAFKALDRKLAFSPCVPDVWFEVRRGETIRDRANAVYTHHYKEQERKTTEAVRPEDDSLVGKAYVSTIEIDVYLPGVSGGGRKKKRGPRFASIFSQEQLSGAEELDKAGECLDWLYPDDLDRAILREGQVEELTRLLTEQDRRPVLLLGPRQSGKTAILHEYVFRKAKRRKNRFAAKNNVWHLSPQRIISGMSVVGQWENRALAIMREAKKHNHVLYFDDLLGLYLAGVCANSSLSVAQVLKPHIEAHEFRVLAESTPEAFRILQERDRGLADMFHIIRISETTRDETLRIMIAAMRQHEDQNRCQFALDVLPTIMELQGRYVHEAAFPGKAATFARRLAIKQRNDHVERQHVLDEFHAVSGLSITFLDGQKKLDREEVEEGIRAGVIGQDESVRAVTDAICKAKARLNDPDRPLGAFLFVGPTGVGKTQCAKAAATYLFGDQERLVRFDMNEYVDAQSAARLVGTYDEPEGLLTSEIRRRPFCVLLLDEIEKAHPDVFDLLLQVLGEGRLTDALGRLADFRNALIILTSNLGAREVRSQLGFRETVATEDDVYMDAARKFFRPEFFNRLDKIIPFAPLSREEITLIADRLIREVMGRHGLRQRKCALQVDTTAMDRLVEAGYHPRLGARALKRIIEQQLAQPVATCLAALQPGVPTVITAYAGKNGIAVSAQGLENAAPFDAPSVLASGRGSAIACVDEFLGRAGAKVEALQPTEPMRAGHILPEHQMYVAVMEETRYVHRLRNRIVEHADRKRPSGVSSSVAQKMRFRRTKTLALMDWSGTGNILQELMAADSVRDAIRELEQASDTDTSDQAAALSELAVECALLERMLNGKPDSRAMLCCLATDRATGRLANILDDFYRPFFEHLWGFTFEPLSSGHKDAPDLAGGPMGWLVSGPGAVEVAQIEAGTHVLVDGEEIAVAVLKCVSLEDSDNPATVLRGQHTQREEWTSALAEGTADAEDDPYRCTPVRRLFDRCSRVDALLGQNGTVVDFRTGMTSRGLPKGKLLRQMVLGVLPMPPEFERDG